jgi:hypothetical protein
MEERYYEQQSFSTSLNFFNVQAVSTCAIPMHPAIGEHVTQYHEYTSRNEEKPWIQQYCIHCGVTEENTHRVGLCPHCGAPYSHQPKV